MIQVNIPQIEVPQGNPTMANKDFMHMLPPSRLYGMHNLRFTDLAAIHIFLNTLLKNVYIEHAVSKEERESDTYYTFDVSHYTYKLNIETVIYWLRKTADELISLLYYIHHIKAHKTEPERISIDCIGKLLNDSSSINESMSSHLKFLSDLNDVSNCYKHSFVNRETYHLIGIEEPTVVGLQVKKNNSSNPYIFHNYFLRDIINEYNIFFKSIRKKLQDLYPYF